MSERGADARTQNILGAIGLALADAEGEAAAGTLTPGDPALTAGLITIANFEPEARTSVVATGLGLSHSGAVRLIDRLMERRLVKRTPDPADGRVVLLELTRAGNEAVRQARKAREHTLIKWLAPLNDEQRATLTDLLETMLTAQTDSRARALSICRMCDPDVCGHPERCPVTLGADAATGRAGA